MSDVMTVIKDEALADPNTGLSKVQQQEKDAADSVLSEKKKRNTMFQSDNSVVQNVSERSTYFGN